MNNFLCAEMECDNGYYSQAGATSCLPCPGGYSCSNKSQLPQLCTAGTYASNASLTCTSCPPGHMCPDSGMVQAIACPAGWYQTSSGQTSCTECGQGKEMCVMTRGCCLLVTCLLCHFSLCQNDMD